MCPAGCQPARWPFSSFIDLQKICRGCKDASTRLATVGHRSLWRLIFPVFGLGGAPLLVRVSTSRRVGIPTKHVLAPPIASTPFRFPFGGFGRHCLSSHPMRPAFILSVCNFIFVSAEMRGPFCSPMLVCARPSECHLCCPIVSYLLRHAAGFPNGRT